MDNPLRQAIVEIVETKQGCKATELVDFIAGTHPELLVVLDDLTDTIEEMVHEGELVEVEYVLPQIEYRAKSYLLPRGTQIIVHDGRMR